MKIDFGKWGLNNSKLVWMLAVILILGGFFSYFKMPKLEDPEIIVRQAMVIAINPGASAHQNELEVAIPLENNLREVDGVDFVETRCYCDVSFLKVSLSVNVQQEDIQQIWDIVRRKVSATELPAGVSTEVMDDFGDVYGMFYSVSGEGYTIREIADYVDLLQRELQNVEGVSRVSLYGMPKECVRIKLCQERLANLGVLPFEVIQTLNSQNATVYSGYFQSGGNRVRVSVDDKYRTIEDISNLIIQGHEKDQLRLCDIADVVQEEESPVREILKRDGIRSIGISISGDSGTDITKVGRDVEKKIKELQNTRIPVGIEVEKVFNQPDEVNHAIGSFLTNLLLSVLLVVLVLVFTMGLRSALIIGASLVTIVAGSVAVLYYTGGTLQRVSLISFIVVMGMLVDNAIVVVDGILVAKAEGKPRMEAITGIGKKTAWPLLGATLIAILAFLPIYLSPDVTGLYVHDMFIVLAVSLLLSWLLAMIHVPVMADKWLYPLPASTKDLNYNGKAYTLLKQTLNVVLEKRWATVFGVIALLVVTGVGAFFLPVSFFPDMEYSQLYMEYKLPEGRNYTQVENDLDSIQRYLLAKPEITHVVTSVGGTPSRYNLVRSLHTPSLSYGELIIDFKSPRVLKEQYHQLQCEVEAMFPDAFIRFKRYNLMFLQYPIQLGISGSDPAVLAEFRDSCYKIVSDLGVCECIVDEWEPSTPSMLVNYDQAAARRLGLSRQEVGASLLASTEGIPIGSFYDGRHRMSIYVDCVDVEGKALTDITNATVFGLTPNVSGLANVDFNHFSRAQLIRSISKNAPLSQVSKGVEIDWEDPVVFRYNGFRTKIIGASPAEGYGTEEARKIIDKAISGIELPDGYSFKWYGEKMASSMAMTNLFNYYPIALLVMLVILLMLFKNYKDVFILVCSIPVIIVGIVPAILMSGYGVGFVSVVGSLGLVGMIIKNGIILMDEIKLQTSSGKEMKTALIDASVSRLRPVTMAAFTTVLGMIPLLFDAMFSPLAAAIIGGLFVGTIIVLVLIPVLYALVYDNKKTAKTN